MATSPFSVTVNRSSSRSAMPFAAAAATVLGMVGVRGIWSTVLSLVDLWRTDPLKSIGAFVPVLSLGLILRVWRALGWKTRGSWWGMAVLLPTIALVHWRDHAVLEFVLSPSWTINLPPHSIVAFAYLSGTVLLFGGTALFRAAYFPILLILLVNPVPHVFSRFVDLPLQHASAVTARAFAHALGQRLTPGELLLMFTPSFGMFIAPGCNGIRGSVTMGLLALVTGYLYRLRLQLWALVVAGALLLGYLFNLLRLCALVLYYVVALRIPWLQSRAELGDYLIGATLFFAAAVLFFTALGRLSPNGDLRSPALRLAESRAKPMQTAGRSIDGFWWRWVACACLLTFGSLSYPSRRGLVDSPPDEAIFPAQVGEYHLRRTWQEKLTGGQTIFDWGEYAPPAGSAGTLPVAVGVSPILGAHDTLVCHTARGEDWSWRGELVLPTAARPVSFSASYYSDGGVGSLEASTVCSGEHCGQWSTARRVGFVYSRADPWALLGRSPDRPIPVLLKVEGVQNLRSQAGVQGSARLQLQLNLQNFLAHTSIGGLTRPYRVR